MKAFDQLIPQNIGFRETRRIGIYNARGNRVGHIPLGPLTFPDVGAKQYSFGAISDVHLQYDTAQDDFRTALTYLNDTEDVAFTCICGDLTVNGAAAELTAYKSYVDTYSADKPVYAVFGNHDTYQGLHANTEAYTGQPLYYTVEQGDDVFIMLGIVGTQDGSLFAAGELQWLYETLEANRNKRCFLFQHVLTDDGCGDVLNIYPYTKMRSTTESMVFKSLLRHYKNTLFFHGHSHMRFSLQEYGPLANYDHVYGIHSIHIPSLAVPRHVNDAGTGYETLYACSEGYVVDVYKQGIHLRGRDFVKGEFLPVASYWLDTTLQEIEEGTYADSTGTIKT